MADSPLEIPEESQDKYVNDIRSALFEDAVEKESLDPITAAQVDDQKTDTALKKLYAIWFIGILIGQLLFMNGIFIAVGLRYLAYTSITLNIFMAGTLIEVFGVVLVITKYLFKKK